MGNNTPAISDGVNSILTRVSDFFHIFDFPFFISGSITMTGFILFSLEFIDFSDIYSLLSTWVGVLLFLISSYVLGLICFTVGRERNKYREGQLLNYFNNSLFMHGLNEIEVVRSYREKDLDVQDSNSPEVDDKEPTNEEVKNWHLYTRMWQDLVEHRPNSLAFKHLSRYWALAALFDSLSVAFGICAILASLSFLISLLNLDLIFTVITLTLALSLNKLVDLFFKQGAKYYKYQIEDLVATMAADRNKIN